MTITINGTTGISGVDGSSSTPSYKGSDSNTGISFGTDTVTINTGGTARVTTDASGNVGIGTVSPNYKLEVNGNSYFSNITMPSGGVTIGTGSVGSIAGAAIQMFGVGTGTYMTLSTNGLERFRLDASGNIGIGTSTPNGRLQIDTSAGNATSFILNQSGIGAASISVPASTNALAFGVFDGVSAIAERMRLDTSGNLRVGVASDTNPIRVVIRSDNAQLRIGPSTNNRYRSDYYVNTAGEGNINVYDDTGAVYRPLTLASSYLAIGRGAGETARFNENGDLGIGTSSPAARLDLGASTGVKLFTYKSGGANSGFGTDLSGSGYELSVFAGGTASNQGIISFGQRRVDTGVYVERARIDSVGTFEQAVANGVPQLSVLNAGTYANGATVGFASMSGFIIVNNWGSGAVGVWIAGAGQVVLVSGLGTTYGSLAYDSGIAGYRWTSNDAVTRPYTFTAIRTRNTA